MKNQSFLALLMLLLLVAGVLVACTGSRWLYDPALEVVSNACRSQSGMDYDCVEREAIAALNPEICRLVGIYIDDMCLQAVYQAADDPTICDRIYLRGVVPNCRAYYAQHTPALTFPSGRIEIPLQTQTPSPTFTLPPTATLTCVTRPTTTPTPLFVFDPTGYDPDLFQPLEVSHNPPLIARSDETVTLVFDLINTIYCTELERYCQLEPLLFFSYGDGEAFQTKPLTIENMSGMESLVARLPAADQGGRSLRYYAEFSVPEAGYSQRYPGAGTIDLFTTDDFISVELPAENAVEPGEKVYDFFWGYGPDKVRQATYEGYPQRVGPPALLSPAPRRETRSVNTCLCSITSKNNEGSENPGLL